MQGGTLLGQVSLQNRSRYRIPYQEEADRIAGEDADYHRRDLFDAIKRGEYPSWTLKVQIMPFEEAADYRFNPFDLTKVWPHADIPCTRSAG